MSELGHMLSHLDRWDEAEPLLRESERETRRLLGPLHGATLRSAEHLADFHRAKGGSRRPRSSTGSASRTHAGLQARP